MKMTKKFEKINKKKEHKKYIKRTELKNDKNKCKVMLKNKTNKKA